MFAGEIAGQGQSVVGRHLRGDAGIASAELVPLLAYAVRESVRFRALAFEVRAERRKLFGRGDLVVGCRKLVGQIADRLQNLR